MFGSGKELIAQYAQSVWCWLRLLSCACADILFPRFCPGCGAWDEDVCKECRAYLSGPWISIAENLPYLLSIGGEDGELCPIIPCYALGSYSGRARALIISWKHSNCARLDRQICELWARGVRQLALGNMCADIITNCPSVERILIVSAPSRWKRQHRGQLVAEKLARAVESECEGYAEVRNVVRIGSELRSLGSLVSLVRQSLSRWLAVKQGGGFHVADRAQRRRKSERIFCAASLEGCAVILVDDVVTTGATALGMVRAIEKSGGKVIGMLALAAAGCRCSQSENIVA